ncbi:response regulator [Desulfocurvus sp. DL9XJH121]
MRILLVDDERELVAALAERLGLRGYETDFAVSGEQALALVAERGYDVAVLDVKMPGMGGIDLYARIREISPGTRGVFLTGHGSANDFKAGAGCGEAYLIKPVPIEVLEETFRRIARGADGSGKEGK